MLVGKQPHARCSRAEGIRVTSLQGDHVAGRYVASAYSPYLPSRTALAFTCRPILCNSVYGCSRVLTFYATTPFRGQG